MDTTSMTYSDLSEDQRYELMGIEKPELSIANWFAREKILFHRASTGLQENEIPGFINHIQQEYPRALRLIEYLDDRLADIIDADKREEVIQAIEKVLLVNMRDF